MNGERVIIELSGMQALVLFDLLTRWEITDADDVHIEHQAEERVLWDILAMLESVLVEPFKPDYHDLLKLARQAVQDTEEGQGRRVFDGQGSW